MKHIYFISAFIIISSLSLAQNYNLIKNNEYHLSYDEFISRYGNDDTSLAIIDIYFDKREYSGMGQMSFLPVSTAVSAICPPIGIGLVAVSSPLFVSGLITYHKYSRKKMLKTLIDYREKATLSKKCRKKVVQLIAAQYEIFAEDVFDGEYDLIK